MRKLDAHVPTWVDLKNNRVKKTSYSRRVTIMQIFKYNTTYTTWERGHTPASESASGTIGIDSDTFPLEQKILKAHLTKN